MRRRGYRPGKFGWGTSATAQFNLTLAGACCPGRPRKGWYPVNRRGDTIWIDYVQPAKLRIEVLRDCGGVTWLEEPFIPGGFSAYHQLTKLAILFS